MHTQLEHDFDELSSAEDFLEYFGIEYDATVVRVNRLHILQRFHDYLQQASHIERTNLYACYQKYLHRAYTDFLHSDARTEKVFKVFRRHEPQVAVIPLHEAFQHKDR